MIYRFDNFELDTECFELRDSGIAKNIEPQVFSLLELLVSNCHRVVSKDEINQHVWAGRVVSEATVNSRIRSARLAIGDNGRLQRLIQTAHNRGFRFIGNPSISDSFSIQNHNVNTLIEQSERPPAESRWLQVTAQSRIGPPFGGLRSRQNYRRGLSLTGRFHQFTAAVSA